MCHNEFLTYAYFFRQPASAEFKTFISDYGSMIFNANPIAWDRGNL
jgi:hypothetical protein